MWLTIIEVVLRLVGYFLGFMGDKKKAYEWMTKASEILRQKGLIRSKFILELEADREAYLDSLMRKDSLEPERPNLEFSVEELSVSESIQSPEFIRVPGVSFKKNGRFKTKSGKARGVVVHYTVSGSSAKSAKGVLSYLASKGLGCPVMDEDGKIYIPEDYDPLKDVVYHAGTSFWKGLTGISYYCIGMEICCWGRLDDNTKPRARAVRMSAASENIKSGLYEPYTKNQEASLINFIKWVKFNSPDFDIDWVVGHDEISPTRKSDPGGSLSMTMPEFRSKLSETL